MRGRLDAAWRRGPPAEARFGIALGLDACLEQGADREGHIALLDEAASVTGDPRQAAYLHFRAARAEFLRGHWEGALERARRLSRCDHGDDELAADVRLIESAALRYVGSPEEAVRIADATLASTSSRAVKMRAHFHRAVALQFLGRTEEVEEASRQALALTIPLRASRHRALVLTGLSIHAFASGRPDLACEYASEAARRFARMGDRLMAGKALTFLAQAQEQRGDAGVRRTQARAQRMAHATGDRAMITQLALLHAQRSGENARARLKECLWDNEALGLSTLAQRVRVAIDGGTGPEHLRLDRFRAVIVHAGTERVIDLSRHEKARRVLRRLAEARMAGQGPLPVEALLVAAWPGERLLATSGQNRVYATIRFLRREGLETLIRSSSAGYELTCPVRISG
jgi:tetratricopeptide (TPR) repeat protein